MRVVTRGDLDGLICTLILRKFESIESVKLIHAQDITDRTIEITDQDILANVPYHPNCAKWFDHHLLTSTNATPPEKFDGAYGRAPSAARLVYDYYGGAETMPGWDEMLVETDRLDSANLEPDDILDPQGWIQLGFTLDSRSNLGPLDEYFNEILGLIESGQSIQDILQDPFVIHRVDQMEIDNSEFKVALEQYSRKIRDVVVTDFRTKATVPMGNRFMIYGLFPEVKASVRAEWTSDRSKVSVGIAKSIFVNSDVNCGLLCAQFGGGGHRGAGRCMLDPATASEQIKEITKILVAG